MYIYIHTTLKLEYMSVSDIHELYNLQAETKQCCEAVFCFSNM